MTTSERLSTWLVFFLGLGTLARSFVRNPVKTVKAIGAFGKHYRAMKKANIKGGNLNAHDKANYDATKIAGKKVK